MDLAGTMLVFDNHPIVVVRGAVYAFHLDRRGPEDQGPPRGQPPRRRVAPREFRALVGTGTLGVARGTLEIAAADARRHTPGGLGRLVVGDLQLTVVQLDEPRPRGSTEVWRFVALFHPTERQKRWLESLATGVDGQAPPAVPGAARMETPREGLRSAPTVAGTKPTARRGR
jgi:hypothetical protein